MSDLELTMMRRVGELKAEVERLNAVIESHKDAGLRILAMLDEERRLTKHLKSEVERLTKGGDAMADEIVGCFNAEGYDPADSDALTNWYAAKEGNGQP
ncbi:MAG: hypothetical protein AN484_15365 [Aphanizomenon flos-aquae WA102]|uniref:Uncharacterized protein n=1 Tax=Aphanizomenon flos-aquae WA102 TaxID=1710896 RepID=A0A1B7X0I2_APHFL|nr:MAG: hypothetical protein AN484_15365 [Aphanizomenon flos-aquae WA102]